MNLPTVYWRIYPGNDAEPTRRRRGLFVCEGLRRLGWNVQNDSPNGCGIAVIQRIANPADVSTHRAAGRIVIFDQNDDLLSKGSRFHSPLEVPTVAAADYIVVGCRYMQKVYARVNPRVLVIPDALEDEHWTTPKADLPDTPLVLSWIGLGDNLQYVTPIVMALGPVPDLRLRIIMPEFDSKRRSNREVLKSWPIPAEFVVWRMDTFLCEMAQAHVGFVPLPDMGFTRSKGPHKSVSYSCFGLPTIASDMPGYREVIKHGETGFLCDTPQQFREAIEALRDPEVRRRIGEAGREFSLHFQRPVIGKLWDRLLRGVLERHNAK